MFNVGRELGMIRVALTALLSGLATSGSLTAQESEPIPQNGCRVLTIGNLSWESGLSPEPGTCGCAFVECDPRGEIVPQINGDLIELYDATLHQWGIRPRSFGMIGVSTPDVLRPDIDYWVGDNFSRADRPATLPRILEDIPDAFAWLIGPSLPLAALTSMVHFRADSCGQESLQNAPGEIKAFNGEEFEIIAEQPPGQATLRDYWGVNPATGQLEISLPTGIHFAGINGNDFDLKINLRSGAYRDGQLGKWFAFNYEDFLTIDKMVPLDQVGQACDLSTIVSFDMQMNQVVNTTPFINRYVGGEVRTYSNLGHGPMAMQVLLPNVGALSHLGLAGKLGIPNASLSTCAAMLPDGSSIADPLTVMSRLAATIPGGGGGGAGLSPSVAASAVVDPMWTDRQSALVPHYSVFAPSPGLMETFEWNCDRIVITDAEGTKSVYSMFYKRKEEAVCLPAAAYGNRGGSSFLPPTYQLGENSQVFSRLKLVAPCRAKYFRDGTALFYIYNRYDQLVGFRDSMGREVHFGMGIDVNSIDANRIDKITDMFGRTTTLEYGVGGLSAINLPTVTTGALGQPTLNRRIKIKVASESLPNPPDYVTSRKSSPDGDTTNESDIDYAERQILMEFAVGSPMSPTDEANWEFHAYFAKFGTDLTAHSAVQLVRHQAPAQNSRAPSWYVDHAAGGPGTPSAGGDTTYEYEEGYWKRTCVPGDENPPPPTKTMKITRPDGSWTELTFDRLSNSELERRESIDAGAYATTSTSYVGTHEGTDLLRLNWAAVVSHPTSGAQNEVYETKKKYAHELLPMPPHQSVGLVDYYQSYVSAVGLHQPWTFIKRRDVVEDISAGTKSPGSSLALTTIRTFGRYGDVKSERSPADVIANRDTFINTFDYEVDPDGKGQGNIVRTDYPAATTPDQAGQARFHTFTYNAFSQVKTSTDALGRVTSSVYHAPNDPDGVGGVNWGTQIADPQQMLLGYPKNQIVDAAAGGLALTSAFAFDVRGNPTSEVSPKGTKTLRMFNEMDQAYVTGRGDVYVDGNDVSVVDGSEDAEKTVVVFDANGNAIESRRFNSNPGTSNVGVGVDGRYAGYVSTKYFYDDLDQLVEVQKDLRTPAAGNQPASATWLSTKWVRDPVGRILWVINPDGTTTSAKYDKRGKMTEHRKHWLAYPGYGTTNDVGGVSAEITPMPNDASDKLTQFAYDANARLVTVTDSEGNSETLHYDAVGRLIGKTDLVGTLLRHTLDPDGKVLAEELFVAGTSINAGSAGLWKKATFQYDERKRLWKRSDFVFNGNPTSPAASVSEQYVLDPEDQVVAVIDQNGNRTDYGYDGAGRRNLQVYPDTLGNPSARSNDHFEFDANGNVTRLSVHEFAIPFGASSPVERIYTLDHTYDLLDRNLSTTRALGTADESIQRVKMYDSLGNAVQTLAPAGNSIASNAYLTGDAIGVEIRFDTAGRPVQIVEGFNDTFLDAPASLKTATNTDGLVTLTKEYDRVGNILAEADDNGNATIYEYDNIQRQSKVFFADGTWQEAQYRRDDLITSLTAKNDQSQTLFTISYGYDGFKRKTSESYSVTQGPFSGLRSKTFAYDELGRPLTATAISDDPRYVPQAQIQTATTRAYDSLGRVTSDRQVTEHKAGGGSTFTTLLDVDVTSEFDDVGNPIGTRSSVGNAANNEFELVRTFDAVNRITGVTDVSNNGSLAFADFEWAGARGRLETIQHTWNGTRTLFNDRDARGRVREIRTQNSAGTTLDGRQYAYSQSSSKLFELKLAPGVTNDDHVFTHDAMDRLKQIEQGDFDVGTATFAATPTSEVLGFDGAGSIRNHTLPSGQSHTNATDATNAYTGTFDGLTVSRDERGNVSELGLMNLVYDVFGHLVATVRPYETPVVPTWEARDAYDRRVYREVSSQKRVFVWNGEQLFQEVNVTNAPSTRTVDREYVHGPGQDFVVAQRIGGVNRGFHVDEMGTPYCATRPNGAVAERYDTDPYGAVATTDVDGGGLLGNRIAMAGQWWDATTNLYYMRARHYSPVLKRFLSRDPIGVWGDALNAGCAYAYVGNRVSQITDPTGLGFPDPRRMFQNRARDVAAGAGDGAITAGSLGFYDSTLVGNAVDADMNSSAYQNSKTGAEIIVSTGMSTVSGGGTTGARLLAGAIRAGETINRIECGIDAIGAAQEGELVNAAINVAGALAGGGKAPDVPTGPKSLHATSPAIGPNDLTDKTKTEIRKLADEKGLVPNTTSRFGLMGDGQPTKYMDPVTGAERIRLDPGHETKAKVPFSGRPGEPHVHGFGPDGETKVRDPNSNPPGDPHFPLKPEESK